MAKGAVAVFDERNGVGAPKEVFRRIYLKNIVNIITTNIDKVRY